MAVDLLDTSDTISIQPMTSNGRGTIRIITTFGKEVSKLEVTIEEWSRALAKPGTAVDAKRIK